MLNHLSKTRFTWCRNGLGFALVILSFVVGCTDIKRTLTIKSDPSGALVNVAGQDLGLTPANGKEILWVADDTSPNATRTFTLSKDGFETKSRRVDWREAKEAPEFWTWSLTLPKLRDEVEVEMRCPLKGCKFQFGDRAFLAGPIKLVFTRPTGTSDWYPIPFTAALEDYESQGYQLEHDKVKADPHVDVPALERIRESLPVEIKANVEDATVKIDGEVAGKTPMSRSLTFARSRAKDDWNSHYIVVEKKDYTAVFGKGEVSTSSVPFSIRLGLEEARKGVVEAKLERVQYYTTIIPSFKFGAEGAGVQQETVLSQVGEIEREPKAGAVTKMSAADETNSLIVSRLAMFPDNNAIGLVVPFSTPRDPSIVFSNLWLQKGQSRIRLTDADHADTDPCLSPDGNWVYFSSNRLSPKRHNIWRIATTGKGGLTKITDSPSAAADAEPAVSPDGTRLAYASLLQEAKLWHIWVANADGTLPAQLRIGRHPAWSPDSRRLAYVAQDQQGRDKIWVMDATGGNPTQLSFGTQADQYPAWLPDGQSIVFASDQGLSEAGRHHFDIWMMKADGTDKTQLTVNGSYDSCPSVSKDGKFVYFFSNRGAQRENDPAALQVWRLELPSAAENAPTTK